MNYRTFCMLLILIEPYFDYMSAARSARALEISARALEIYAKRI